MKKILLLVLATLTFHYSIADRSPYEMLTEINPEWNQHQDYLNSLKSVDWLAGDRPDIKTHLFLVEKELRMSTPSGLSEEQYANRIATLDILHNYWNAEAFPINEHIAKRWPVFIDNYDNFCAVGHLLNATGYEEVARDIAKSNNLILVKEIKDERLVTWAREFGFTVDELAWIQPGYLPTNTFNSLGSGTDGVVYDLAVDQNTNILYVGGDFNMVDGAVTVNNIAMWYPGFAGYDWLNMGSGVNGPVSTIVVDNNDVYVGGAFTDAGGVTVKNIARWDGAQWHAVGNNIAGSVLSLQMYQGELYAGGFFSNTGPTTLFNNFAKFDGTNWVNAGGSPNGYINIMEQSNGKLILAGNFAGVTSQTGNTNMPNVAAYNGTMFNDIGAGVPATVTTLEEFNGRLYAGGYFVSGVDTFGIASYDSTTMSWENHLGTFGTPPNFRKMFLCDMYAHSSNRLVIGGWFNYTPMSGYSGASLVSMSNQHYFQGEGLVDSTVAKLAFMNGEWFMGGYFQNISGQPFNYIVTSPLNGPGSGIDNPISASDIVLYPNPSSDLLFVKQNDASKTIERVEVYNMLGEVVVTSELVSSSAVTVSVKELSAGNYIAVVHTSGGEVINEQFSVSR